ncbi:hypothetical protein [uncultured Parabacteroides sp.]|uniref:hypothetical protein n=1 Tax=uncultured Parabacteroides sp. TaxID=512312 RepID=UPI0025ED05D0|nr:hypothetical protein [uncultured Parabacteroides sp.]
MMRFIGLVLLIGLVTGCSPERPVPVRIGYVETDVPSSNQCVEITGAFQGRPYQLRMAHSLNGNVNYKALNEAPYIMQDTVLRISMAVEPRHKHTARFTLDAGSVQVVEEAELEDVLHSILLETYSDRSFTSSDTIPLTSYSNGALYEVMVDGQLQQGGSYCNVRNAKLPPKEWHKAFDMKEYIWFELLFTGK